VGRVVCLVLSASLESSVSVHGLAEVVRVSMGSGQARRVRLIEFTVSRGDAWM
jgi:hypothetical protein